MLELEGMTFFQGTYLKKENGWISYLDEDKRQGIWRACELKTNNLA